MTEQELRATLKHLLMSELPVIPWNKADFIINQILALIKEAGYKSPEERFKEIADAEVSRWNDCVEWHRANGDVKLAGLVDWLETEYAKAQQLTESDNEETQHRARGKISFINAVLKYIKAGGK